jgi:hypothetical protein
MNREIHRNEILAAVAFLIFLAIVYLYIFEPFVKESRYLPTGIGDFRDKSSYSIDPTTILEDVSQGKTDVFERVGASQQTQLIDEPFSWQQGDFVQVARAFNQSVWKEPLSRWRLYSMDFSAPCQDNPSGFNEGNFYYFKTTFHNNGKIRYTTQSFFILLQYGRVNWTGGSNFPHPLFGWENIKLSELQTTAEDALTIADENGGKEARQLVENKCKIHVGLSGDHAWQVFIYSDDINSLIFNMEIDPKSGAIE